MTIVAEHPELDSIISMLKAGMRGREISDWLHEHGYPSLHRKQINDYYRRHLAAGGGSTPAQVHIESEDDDIEEQLAKAKRLIERARAEGLDPKSVRVEAGDSQWDAYAKDADGKTIPDKKRSDRKKVSLTVSDVPPSGSRVEVRQAEPVEIWWSPERPSEKSELAWAVIMPDAQRPFEDQAAVDVALQILAEVQRTHGVDRIIHLGDDLDLPEFGRHRTAPEALGSLNDAISRQHRVLAMERAIAPDAQIDWLEGNHETRLVTWLVDNCDQLIGLRRAGSRNNDDPVLSIPYLCRLSSLDVNYVAPYPEGEIWLNSNFRAIHGDTAKGAKGATAAGYLAKGDVSTVYGHIHRSELVYTTRHTHRGPRTFLAGSPGCLCDIGGRVPSAKSGINADGRHGRLRTEDWQQGIWVVSYETGGKELYNVEPVTIWGGEATFRGHTYVASGR